MHPNASAGPPRITLPVTCGCADCPAGLAAAVARKAGPPLEDQKLAPRTREGIVTAAAVTENGLGVGWEVLTRAVRHRRLQPNAAVCVL